MTEEQTRERLEDLQRKLKAREGKPGWAVNAEEIRAEIERLEATLPTSDE